MCNKIQMCMFVIEKLIDLNPLEEKQAQKWHIFFKLKMLFRLITKKKINKKYKNNNFKNELLKL